MQRRFRSRRSTTAHVRLCRQSRFPQLSAYAQASAVAEAMADRSAGRRIVPINHEVSAMSETGKAVFLSYASQDAEVAARMAEAIRRGGVEVWLDQEGGLVGGDAWDRKIREQINGCALFVPIISANTQARHEGYSPTRTETGGRPLASHREGKAVYRAGECRWHDGRRRPRARCIFGRAVDTNRLRRFVTRVLRTREEITGQGSR
ncbi:MAG: toll/interleukin-1 receptor domain-containing protein [Opitutus sp.]|nr:toll/interleukin-1 receptor domain-containing protein [Opitutus sp.]